MADFYTREQRSAYNKQYRLKHLKHLAFCSQFYHGGEEISLRARIKELSDLHGGLKAVAKKFKIDRKSLIECLNGQRPVVPNRDIFRKLGLRVVLKFERL